MKPVVVVKFGGSSLSSETERCRVVERIRAMVLQGIQPVVVVSAMGRRGSPYATDSLIDLLGEGDLDPRTVDFVISCGETISAGVLTQLLWKEGIRAMALNGWQAGIETDGLYGNAEIVQIHTQFLTELLEQEIVPVITGFQGVSQQEITTLGRGGSDTSAVEIAGYLKAERVEILTDVSGVKVADPRRIPEAKQLPFLSYEDMLLAANQGASVIHPRAVQAAQNHQIPMIIGSSQTLDPGTLVGNQPSPEPLINLSYSTREQTIALLLNHQIDENQTKRLLDYCDSRGLVATMLPNKRTIQVSVTETQAQAEMLELYQLFYQP